MSLTTFAVQIAGADFSAIGDKITADPVIRDGTLWCFDAADEYSYPSQADSSETAEFINLVEGEDDATFGSSTLTFADGGFAFSTSSGQVISLPDAAKFAGITGGFAAVYWIKFGAQTQSVGGSVAGFYDFTNGNGPFGIALSSGSIKFYVNGTVSYSQSWSAETEPHAYAVAMVNDPDDGWRGRVYKDGVLVGDVAVDGTLTAPTIEPNYGPFIGDGGANGVSSYAVLNVYRSYGIDLDGWDIDDLVQLLLEDYEDNASRFA